MNQEPIILHEFAPYRLPASEISREAGQKLWQEFGKKIDINEPSFKNDHQWELTSLGWVGFIPFSEDLSFHLKPKIPLVNLFGMWEYAYRLKGFQFIAGLAECQSIQEFYEQLALVLARRIQDRSKKGYYRAYVPKSESLPFLRGRLLSQNLVRKPWEVSLTCDYHENTADVEENQILAWTLFTILRSGVCSERALPIIRNSFRSLEHIAALEHFKSADCVGRLYNRLNHDYQPLHALCRFFLENIGPSYEVGDRTMLPFLVDMASLFELFVAEWLHKHLPPEYELNQQEHLVIDAKGDVFFKIDLVLYNIAQNKTTCVMDTKYKNADKPSSADIAQVVFYALAKDCQDAILVYPRPIEHPMDTKVNGIRIRSASFCLDGDLEKAGQEFLDDILEEKGDFEIN